MLFACTNFAILRIHKASSHFVIAWLTYRTFQWDVMRFPFFIDAIHYRIVNLTILMRAKLSFVKIRLKFVWANNTCFFTLKRGSNDWCAFVTDFTHLRDFMDDVFAIDASEIDLIGKTFLIVVRTERGKLIYFNTH